MSDSRPIAVFDSGVGGLSVLCRLVQMLPEEDFIYLGDRKNAPYGEKTHEEVRALAEQNAEYLFSLGAKSLVIACNTATAAAVADLRQMYPDVPIIGTEPAVKPAVDTGCRRILVLATPRTVREEKFRTLLSAHSGTAEVIPIGCDGLADMIEHGLCNCGETDEYFRLLFAPYRAAGFDGVVLGCTHYPFARAAIERAVGENVRIFDGAIGTARQTGRMLEKYGISAPEGRTGKVRILSTDGNHTALRAFFEAHCTGGNIVF